jgi:microcin C transport system substrate-binding protein
MHQVLSSLRLSGRWLLALAGVFFLVGCGKKKEAVAERDNTAEVKAYYAANPDFFRFATPADLPKDLEWENGADLPEIGSPAAKKGGTFHTFIQDYPRTLRHVGPDANGSFRPWLLDDVVVQWAWRHPTKTDVGPKGFHFFSGLASEWAIDKARKTVWVRIERNARWSDGVPITSDDMLFAFYFWRSKYIQDPWYNNYYTTNFAGITRYDSHTFSITLPEDRPDMSERVLKLYPQPAHFFKELGDDFLERYQWRAVPTPGAYTILPEDIDKGRSITLTRVKDWWAKDKKNWRYRFNPDKIRFSVIRDTPKSFEAFKKGEIDFFNLSLAEYWYDKLPDSDPLVQSGLVQKNKFYQDFPRPTFGLWMNTSRPLLDNREVRVGIQYATNWQLVIDKFARGDWQRMQTGSDGYGEFTHPTLRSRPFSIEQALESFAKAGFTTRGPDGVLVNAKGERLSFQLTTGYEALKDVLTILREEALKAGVEFRIEVLDGTTAFKKLREKQHDISYTAFSVSPEMYPRYWEDSHSVNAYDNAFLPDGTVNPERKLKTQTNNVTSTALHALDQKIVAYDRSSGAEEMKKLAFEMEEMLYEHAAFSPGQVVPFMRTGSWRWIGYPEDFHVKLGKNFTEWMLFWVDEEKKKETLDARRTGATFPPVIRTYDQYKTKD